MTGRSSAEGVCVSVRTVRTHVVWGWWGGLGISETPEHHPFWPGGRLLLGEDPQDKEFPEVSAGAVGVPSAQEGVHRRRGRGSRPPHAAPSCMCVCVGGVLPRSLRVNRSNTPTLMQL